MKLALFIHLLAAGVWLCCLLVALVPDRSGPAFRNEINSRILLPAMGCVLLSGAYMTVFGPYPQAGLFTAKMVFAVLAILATAASIRLGAAAGDPRILQRRELAARRIALPCLMLSLGIGLLFFVA